MQPLLRRQELLPDSEAPSASAHAAAHVAAPMPLIQPRFNVYEGPGPQQIYPLRLLPPPASFLFHLPFFFLPSSFCPFPSDFFPFPSSLFPLPSSLFPFPVSRFPFPLFPLPSSLFPLPSSLFPLLSSLFPLSSSLFPLPSSLFALPAFLSRNCLIFTVIYSRGMTWGTLTKRFKHRSSPHSRGNGMNIADIQRCLFSLNS